MKGGGEVKKKQRCFFKRFAALVAALVLCLALCVPCFASNNAQWRKWVVRAERQLTNEQGTQSRYFQLTPFQNGQIYAALVTSSPVTCNLTYIDNGSAGSTSSLQQYFLTCLNYPDWWRSAIPLGAASYLQVDVKSISSDSTPYPNKPTPRSSCDLFVFDSSNAIYFSLDSDGASSAFSSSGRFSGSIFSSSSSPFFCYTGQMPDRMVNASYVSLSVGSSSLIRIDQLTNVRVGSPVYSTSGSYTGLGFGTSYLTNLSSDNLVLGVRGGGFGMYCTLTAEFSFWVDANKLPAGLQVGDEFPADTDAFDQLRDELLDQFPEAADNIDNGKATIQGWNDTETVDSAVASTSISALNALFQNLGGFLFIVSLMIFGAVVLRMLIRKAVDG